ncbi:hypothetical protein CVT24_002858 [Panaeolus cyanescens]|uniref:TEA domain-containing protein n=1 Tax=Panaeolus cyanescens TaxID=181874 RepID=A0A409VN22_9AGAR|nr:hypothetical protein CVT24_002858 [Panaeolus cyanescens]
MSFSDWNAGVSDAAMKPDPGFVCISTTVDDLSYTPSEEEKYRDAEQVSITGRRSWKTLKGKGEAVWPPIVEAALLEALESYQPDSVGFKSTKNLGRFPMRNRFISDYILEATGKHRTPKQVGSRLQQLRDTCRDERILQLISRRGSIDSTNGDCISDYSSQASPCPSPDLNGSHPRHMSVHSAEPTSPPQSYAMYTSAPTQNQCMTINQQPLPASRDNYSQWQTMSPTTANYDFSHYQASNYRGDSFELAPSYHHQANVASMPDPSYHQPRAVQAIPKYLVAEAYGGAYHAQPTNTQTNSWMQSQSTYHPTYAPYQ